ncbi:histidine phosphatase family protein [Nocardioides albidus]|uniref:Histidine phosphatase family protein n=1 Tax=Nocardioides albidus TaxID=1517589 RepID=A0A5C4WPP4_9ACTN|nr:histidine phosphatase family protein [Nocardioides albidus]TNM50234.1 histidine phosphatase family protein [Nocardioides albidus]
MNRRIRASLVATTAAVLAITPFLTGAQAGAKPTPAGPGYDLLFVRHAHTNYPVPEQELSATGIQQATALANALHDAPIESVDTSMMVRSFQTGDNVAADHDLPVRADEAISEVAFNLADVPPAQQLQKVGEMMGAWLGGQQRANGFGGESYDEVVARWTPWWEQYVREHRNDRGTGVVVAHGALLALMLQRTCANEVTPAFALQNGLANTGIVKAHLSPNGTLTCTEWNGVAIPSAS